MGDRYDYVVNSDGSGDFRTIQEALDASIQSGGRILVRGTHYLSRPLEPPPGVKIEIVGANVNLEE